MVAPDNGVRPCRSSTPPATESRQWKHAELRFEEGRLGFVVSGGPQGIVVQRVIANGQAHRLGLRRGDFIVGINGKSVTELVDNSSNAFHVGKYIDALPRPLAIMTYRNLPGSLSKPMMAREISKDSVKIEAGQTFKQIVFAPKGCDVQFSFALEEEGCDIVFSVEQDGAQPLIHPYLKRVSKKLPCGPLLLSMEEDQKLIFSFDNSHSWVRSKTLSFKIMIEDPGISVAEKQHRRFRYDDAATAAEKLQQMGITAPQPQHVQKPAANAVSEVKPWQRLIRAEGVEPHIPV